MTIKSAKQYNDLGFAWPIDLFEEAAAKEHHQRLIDYEKQYGLLHYRMKPYLVLSSAWEIATHPLLLDVVPANVAFQREIERKKREVYAKA